MGWKKHLKLKMGFKMVVFDSTWILSQPKSSSPPNEFSDPPWPNKGVVCILIF